MTRLALVGYGRIAPKHLEAFRALGCDFVACCNRSATGRERATAEGGIPRTYSEIPAMLAAEKPDGVVCCASLDQVYSTAKQIIPSGIPTLLEKPPGTSLAEWQALCDLADQHQTPVMVGLNRPHYSVLRRALDDAGGLEAITAVFVDWSEDPQHCLNRGLTPAQVERMIFGNSLHGLHLLTTLAGDVPQPHVITRNLGEPFRWLMSLHGISSRGVLTAFNSTWDSPGGWRLTFCTRGRRYIFAPLETCQVQTTGQKELRRIEPDDTDQNFKPGFYRQSQVFLQAIGLRTVPARHGLDGVGPAMHLAALLTNAYLTAIDKLANERPIQHTT
jgi:predicted dehydrogenase